MSAPPVLPALSTEWQGVPFGASFFAEVLPSRVRDLCPGRDADVPVVLLHLGDGTTLDVCHVAQLAPRWIALAVFGEQLSCERMDLVYVPYEAIVRITVSRRPPSARPIGFRVDGPVL